MLVTCPACKAVIGHIKKNKSKNTCTTNKTDTVCALHGFERRQQDRGLRVTYSFAIHPAII